MPTATLTDRTIPHLKTVPGTRVMYIDRSLKGFGICIRPQVDEIVRLAKRTIATATDDPEVLWMVGWSLAYLAGENMAGTTLTERSLTLNPNCAQARLASGFVNLFGNRIDGNRGSAACCALEPARSAGPHDHIRARGGARSGQQE